MTSSNSVTFILEGYPRRPIGGVKEVFLYANYLVQRGQAVTICFDCAKSFARFHLPASVHDLASDMAVAYYPRWFPLSPDVKKICVETINDATIPDADHIVATACTTAVRVKALSARKGKKHYLIQDYETWAMEERDLCETYRLGMSNIVVSNWLRKLVGEVSGVAPTLVKNAVDERLFYPNGTKRAENEIAVLYNEGKHKGFSDLFKALTIVKEQYPGLCVNAFGAPPRPRWFPNWMRYTRSANEAQLRQLYSQSSIYACATINEGFGLTLPESMFCGCALVSTAFPAVYEYADEDCALLSRVGDEGALARNILKLLQEPAAARATALRGRAKAMEECSRVKAEHAIDREFGIG